MKGPSFFQFLVIGVCTALLVVGILIFAVLGGAFGGTSGTGNVVIWGTLDAASMQSVLESVKQTNKNFSGISYVQKTPATYESDLINAIASGNSPDIFLLPQEDILFFKDKVSLISWNSLSQSDFQNSFIGEGDLYLTPNGALALPFTVDPLVMYYNRDRFSTAGIAQAPQYWSDVLTDVPSLTLRDNLGNIQKSGAALGIWQNIPDAKAILVTLFLQAGDKLVTLNESGTPIPVFGTNVGVENPASSALQFYTQFADASKTSYSWNRSLPSAPDSFAAGDTAIYFGFASEYKKLQERNPNLNFSVALLPQAHGTSNSVTYGAMQALAISRAAKNPTGALTVALALTGQAPVLAASQALGLPPVRRDLLTQNPSNAVATVFAQSALISGAFLDPNPQKTNTIFGGMVESVLSGKSTPADTVAFSSQSFAELFPH